MSNCVILYLGSVVSHGFWHTCTTVSAQRSTHRNNTIDRIQQINVICHTGWKHIEKCGSFKRTLSLFFSIFPLVLLSKQMNNSRWESIERMWCVLDSCQIRISPKLKTKNTHTKMSENAPKTSRFPCVIYIHYFVAHTQRSTLSARFMGLFRFISVCLIFVWRFESSALRYRVTSWYMCAPLPLSRSLTGSTFARLAIVHTTQYLAYWSNNWLTDWLTGSETLTLTLNSLDWLRVCEAHVHTYRCTVYMSSKPILNNNNRATERK